MLWLWLAKSSGRATEVTIVSLILETLLLERNPQVQLIHRADIFPVARQSRPGIQRWVPLHPSRRSFHSGAKLEPASEAHGASTYCVKECSQDTGSGDLKAGYRPFAAAIAQARSSVREIGQLLLGSHSVKEGQEKCEGAHTRRVISASSEDSFLTQVRFDELNLSPISIKALHNVLRYERMTPVQEATLSIILQGKDVLVKAKTGTGKTIAFLLPAIEAVLEDHPNSQEICSSICSVIVCPTRELAFQIHAQAQILSQFHTGLEVKLLTRGFRVSKERKSLQASSFQMVVTTPGRFLDHIEKTEGFKQRLEKVRVLVIDEADHVLDMGFRKSVEDIVKSLSLFRQTLLFSATTPKEVRSISKVALKEDYLFIDTVRNISMDTHGQVKEKYIIAPVQKHIAVLYSVLQDHIRQDPNYKVLVFCITARITAFMCQLYQDLGFNCSEIHSKRSQMYRIHTYKEFRVSEGSTILFTSDVSARGVDYRNVTLVIQVGLPDHGGKYIHRIRRTGRIGKSGESLLLLTPWEEFFLDKIRNQPIEKISTPDVDSLIDNKIVSSLARIDSTIRMHAYRTWLGYYLSLNIVGLSKKTIISYANEFSVSIGFDLPPALPRSIVSKLALCGVPGLTKR